MSFDHIRDISDNPDIDQPLEIPFSLYGFPWSSEQGDELRSIMNQFIGIVGGLNLPDMAMFAADSMVLFSRQARFQSDKAFRHTIRSSDPSSLQKGFIWRAHVLCWAAGQALKTEGSFVDCGCRDGFWIAVIAHHHNLGIKGPLIYGYDLSDHQLSEETPHKKDPLYISSPPSFDQAQRRFKNMPLIKLICGQLPQSIESEPQHIAYLHIDMGMYKSEISVLETLFPRIVKGGILIIESYGWQTYKDKRADFDLFAKDQKLSILELPTGQGLIIRP